jgi:hypothetical protein
MPLLHSRIRRYALVLTSVGALAASAAALAHHAFAAEFDADQPIDLKGSVTKIKWVNPHSWLFFDVKDAGGNVTNWGVEFGAPNQLARIGLKKTDVAIGTEVHIKGYRSKNGGPFGSRMAARFRPVVHRTRRAGAQVPQAKECRSGRPRVLRRWCLDARHEDIAGRARDRARRYECCGTQDSALAQRQTGFFRHLANDERGRL